MEMCISTLEALVYNGPLRITRIMYKVNMNCGQLKMVLEDLIKNDLVKERKLEANKVVYAATPQARKILIYFEGLKEMLPIAEEAKLTF
jgi:predicted transcriptional regulator